MKILMMGTGTFAEPTFQALLHSRHTLLGLVTNPDRPSGKTMEMERPIKKLALQAGLPVFQPENINAPESVAELEQRFQPDIYVVAAYGCILSSRVLQIPARGGVNVHSSLLPKYRGAAPIAWAIYHGERETGVTIIRMSPRMDAGEMLASVAEPIYDDDTAATLEARLAQAGARLALTVLEQIEHGREKGVPQDLSQVTHAPKLTKEMGLVTFERTAREVDCQIRAMQPWPTAYTYWHKGSGTPARLLLLQAKPAADQGTDRPPGEVIAVLPDRVLVACGQGTVLELYRVQPSGKKPLEMAAFLRGYRVEVGHRLADEKLRPA